MVIATPLGHEHQRGEALAAALTGAWRRTAPPLRLTPGQLEQIAPLLIDAGAAGLVWWRLRGTPLGRSVTAFRLRQASARRALEAGLHEERLQPVLSLVRSAGVEPILCKGWSAARLYPEPGLRPHGDIDLCVAPGDLPAALAVLKASPALSDQVDLHPGIPDLKDRSWEQLFRRSRLLPLGATPVRVLGPEDQLRHLCLHFWRHLGCRPLWLCDIAAALESVPADFDWDYCLSGRRHLTDWVRSVLGLAHHLVGARANPPAVVAGRLPRGLAPAVLWRWGAGLDLPPWSAYLRHPAALAQALWRRWFNPFRATFRTRLRASHSRLFVQLAALCLRPVEGVVRLRRGLRRGQETLPFQLHQERTF